MLIDTDVFIWFMRGNENARKALARQQEIILSAITYMELIQGLRNAMELRALRKALHAWNAKVLYVNEEISNRAVLYMEKHFLSHSLQLADALIGATASTYDLPLLTGNARHYKVITDLTLKKFRP
ncbi:MAG: type II toxin-antitoxin system VapC family toxin [Thermodesulfobacteriota bacterium]